MLENVGSGMPTPGASNALPGQMECPPQSPQQAPGAPQFGPFLQHMRAQLNALPPQELMALVQALQPVLPTVNKVLGPEFIGIVQRATQMAGQPGQAPQPRTAPSPSPGAGLPTPMMPPPVTQR